MSQEPSTTEEWQQAVDQSEILLMIESAKAYGLITGGPVVNTERCQQLLARGAAIGIRPAVTEAKIHELLRAVEGGS